MGLIHDVFMHIFSFLVIAGLRLNGKIGLLMVRVVEIGLGVTTGHSVSLV